MFKTDDGVKEGMKTANVEKVKCQHLENEIHNMKGGSGECQL